MPSRPFSFLSGVIRRHAILMRVALVVVFSLRQHRLGRLSLSKSASAGRATSQARSWAGLLAVVWRKEGPQPPPLPPEEKEESETG